MLFVVAGCWWLRVGCWWWFAVCSVLLAVVSLWCLPFVAYVRLLFVVCCLLRAVVSVVCRASSVVFGPLIFWVG